MKRRTHPLWLLRDVHALVHLLRSFWTLMIHVILSGADAMAGRPIADGVHERLCRLLAQAEAHLDFTLWREAYRRIGWSPRLVAFNDLPPPVTMDDLVHRWEGYAYAIQNMEQVIDAYVEHMRQQYRISERSARIARGSTHAALCAAAHHELVGVAALFSSRSPLALILSSALRARPLKDERSSPHARGPPNASQNQPNSPRRPPPLRDRTLMPENKKAAPTGAAFSISIEPEGSDRR